MGSVNQKSPESGAIRPAVNTYGAIEELDAPTYESEGSSDSDRNYRSVSFAHDVKSYSNIHDVMGDPEPVDKMNIAYIIWVILGTGMLLGWNAFISVPNYFEKKYNDSEIEYYFQLAYTVPNVIGVAVLVRYGHRLSFRTKVFPPFLVCFAAVAVVPIIGLLPLEKSVAEILVVVCVFIAGTSTSMFQGGLFGFAGTMPFRYTQALMVGNGVAGMLASFLSLLMAAFVPDDKLGMEADIYFSISALVILISIILFAYLQKMPLTKYYVTKNEAASRLKRYASKRVVLPADDPDLEADVDHEILGENAHVHPKNDQEKEEIRHLLGDQVGNVDDVYQGQGTAVHPITVLKKIYPTALAVFFCFFVTLSVFPAITVHIHGDDKWFPTILLTLFNVMDFVGRSLAGLEWKISEKSTIGLSYVRWIFQPLFLACLHSVFEAKWISVLIMIFMGVSNGYVSTLCMVYGPQRVKPHEQDTAGTAMTLFLLLGIACGSGFAFFLKFFNKHVLS